MRPAICTDFSDELTFAQSLEMIRDAGFEVICIGGRAGHAGYDSAAGRAAIAHLLRKHDLSVDSVHAPFPEGDRLFSLADDERVESIRQCETAMDAAAELDGHIVVIHLIQPYDIPEGEVRSAMIERGRESVGALAEQAAARGVKLALENGQRRAYDQVLEDLLAEFRDEHVGFCYDAGHENVQGTCFRLLEQYGDRLLTLHLHDNHGSDSHMLPYEGTIDWDRFRTILSGLEYDGNLLLEASMGKSQFNDPAVFLSEAWKRAETLLP